MAESFTKLFSSITDSTIWNEDDATRIVWITMLAMCDQDGYVGASIPGLAIRARKTVAETSRALKKLLSPDPHSRTKDHEGRRIAEVDRGWVLLNYHKFREARDDEARRRYERERKRDQRAKTSGTVRDIPGPSHGVTGCLPPSAQAEAEAEADQIGADSAPARDHAGARLWAPFEWCRRYGLAWCEKYKQLAYGMPGDAKGNGALAELFERMPEAERLAAQADAPRMFAEYLAREGRDAQRRHPFVFFAQEWGGLRVPASPPPKAAAGPSYRKL